MEQLWEIILETLSTLILGGVFTQLIQLRKANKEHHTDIMKLTARVEELSVKYAEQTKDILELRKDVNLLTERILILEKTINEQDSPSRL